MTKEEIYDSEIYPLMGKILEICMEHKIAMVASFCVEPSNTEHEDGTGPLFITSALLAKEYDPPDVLTEMKDLIYNPEPSFMSLMLTTRES